VGRYSRRISICAAAVVLMSSFAVALVAVPSLNVAAAAVHAPIRIDGNDEFTSENGITGGIGTEDDPYLLEGWQITPTDTPGIYISNSSAWLVISQVIVEGGSPNAVGMLLESCSNVTVSCCVLAGNRIGAVLEASWNTTIADSDLHGNEVYGMALTCPGSGRDSNISIVGNSISDNGDRGIICEGLGGTGVSISRNRITEDSSGIHIHWLHDSVVSWNVIANLHGGIGIEIACSSNVTVSDNTIRCEVLTGEGIGLFEGMGGRYIYVVGNNISGWNAGIAVSFVSEILSATIVSNSIAGNYQGVHMYGGISVVMGNSFLDNEIHAVVSYFPSWVSGQTTVKWNGTYPTGGNYWDNYTGVDQYSGSLQTESGEDGIGDIPFVIDGNNTDFYPLMQPATAVNTEPVAFFTVTPSPGDTISAYEFDASGSWDKEDSTEDLEVRWNWEDDGVWDTDWSKEKSASHKYPIGGVYVVRLEVRDSSGLSNETTRTLMVNYLVEVEVTPEKSVYAPGELVNFTVSITNLAEETITLVFGDSLIADFMVLDDEDEFVYCYYPYAWFMVTYLTIDPLETISYDFQWNQTRNSAPDGAQVETPDIYTILGRIRHWGEGMTDSVQIIIEDESPATAPIFDGVEGTNDWYTSSVNISFDACDEWSVVDHTEYSVDGSEWSIYSSPFELSEDGIYVIEYFSVDCVGNQEEVRLSQVRIDRTAPNLSISLVNGTVLDSSSVNISFSCTDSCSGIDYIEYRLDNGTFVECENETCIQLSLLGKGSHRLSLRVYDLAGNMATHEVTFEVSVAVDDDGGDEDEGEGKSFIESYGLALGIVVALAVIALLLFFVLKGRKGGMAPTTVEVASAGEPEAPTKDPAPPS
jgi:parallel beta-helix repeat protein